jgi:hypothetical protein
MTAPLKVKDHLILAAAHMRRAAPNSFVDFLKAFENFKDEKSDACVVAKHDTVLNAQGQAQAVRELYILFVDCLTEANQLDQRMKGK